MECQKKCFFDQFFIYLLRHIDFFQKVLISLSSEPIVNIVNIRRLMGKVDLEITYDPL